MTGDLSPPACSLIPSSAMAGRVVFRIIPYKTWLRTYRPRVAPGGEHEEAESIWRYVYDDARDLPPGITQGHIWTVRDGWGSRIHLSNGPRIVDRLGYIVCEVPWTGTDELQVDP